MPIEVKKKDKETTASLLRRFSRRVQQSRLLISAKSNRFYKKPKTKRQEKVRALQRERILKERKKMIRMGLLEEKQLIPKEKLKKILQDQA